MSEGAPIPLIQHTPSDKVPQEEKPAFPHSYLEDSDQRQRRDIETLKQNIAKEFEQFIRTPEFATLEGDELLERVSEIGVKAALDLVTEKYDYPESVDSKLAFHNREHSELVVKRFEQLVNAANDAVPGTVSLLENMEGKMAAATHDADHVFVLGPDGSRKRIPGEGEERSAARLTAIKESLNENLVRAGKTSLFSIDAQKDKDTIAVTVPGFDVTLGALQINLKPETSLTDRFLALADLGDFGMDGVDKLLRSGRQLAIEENSDIVEAERRGDVPEEAKEGYATRLKNFMRFQPVFAAGRKFQFEREIDGIEDSRVKAAVVAQFPNFEEQAYQRAQGELAERLKEIPAMDYDAIVKYVGVREFVRGSTV